MARRLLAITTLLLAAAVSGCGGGGSGSAPEPTPAPAPTPTPAPTPAPSPDPTPGPAPTAAELDAASRLLARTTFGADAETIEAVAQQGVEAWLDAQFALPPSRHLPIVERWIAEYGLDPDGDPPSGLYRRFAFWERAMTAPDQLRQRVAYALGQIFVVSDRLDFLAIEPRALASYHDLLLEHAFGNYRDLLRAVTLHPAMGLYLSHVNNARSDPARGTFPDENYAREVMQLFSIGLFELNPDGTPVPGPAGRPVPTYDNGDIQEYAKVFTGLSWGPQPAGEPSLFDAVPGVRGPFGNPRAVLHVPMEMFDAFHEPGEKRLLRGQVLPAGQTGLEDLDDAIDGLAAHPNVGPFLGRRLIQLLVTSNPSPAYVARVAAAFDGDGAEPRGDLERTLRAVLLDPEALAAPGSGAPGAGKLREPFLRYLALHRALGARSADGRWAVVGGVVQALTGQYPLSAPSVFNFYQPDFAPAGPIAEAGLVAPEFQITTDPTIVGVSNLPAFALFGDFAADTLPGFGEVTLDLADFEALGDDPDALLDRIDRVFTYGTLSDETRAIVREAVAPLAADPALAARAALYLVLVSPDYAVAL